MMNRLITLLTLAFITQTVFAQDIRWNGGTGNWNDPNNWDCSCIPNDSLRLEIDNGTVTIPANYFAISKEITITETGQLINEGDLELKAMTSSGGLFNHGNFVNNGLLHFDATATSGINNFNRMTNNGTIEVDLSLIHI